MQFQKGQSGNPAGRPRGSRNKTTVLMQNLLEGEAEAIARKAIEMAKTGDMAAIRVCMDRLASIRRKDPVAFELPPVDKARDSAAAVAAVISAMAHDQRGRRGRQDHRCLRAYALGDGVRGTPGETRSRDQHVRAAAARAAARRSCRCSRRCVTASPDVLFPSCYGPVIWRSVSDQSLVNTGQSELRSVFLLLFTGEQARHFGRNASV